MRTNVCMAFYIPGDLGITPQGSLGGDAEGSSGLVMWGRLALDLIRGVEIYAKAKKEKPCFQHDLSFVPLRAGCYRGFMTNPSAFEVITFSRS
jgi:hypothetical protein